MLRYLNQWLDQLRWQRLEPFQKLGLMLAEHVDGILNYCRTKVRMGVVEAVNGDIKTYSGGVALPEPQISIAEGATHGRAEDGIRSLQKSGINAVLCRPTAESPFSLNEVISKNVPEATTQLNQVSMASLSP